MKHGYRHDRRQLPPVCLATPDIICEKGISNTQEIKSRSGKIIAVATGGHLDSADEVIYTPATLDFLQLIHAGVALQLLAYHCATERACEIDQPRNLAKSVMVE